MKSTQPQPELMLLAKFANTIGASPDTIYRWMTRGVKHPSIPDKGRVRLKLTRMPGGWGISRADYDSFIAELNEKP